MVPTPNPRNKPVPLSVIGVGHSERFRVLWPEPALSVGSLAIPLIQRSADVRSRFAVLAILATTMASGWTAKAAPAGHGAAVSADRSSQFEAFQLESPLRSRYPLLELLSNPLAEQLPMSAKYISRRWDLSGPQALASFRLKIDPALAVWLPGIWPSPTDYDSGWPRDAVGTEEQPSLLQVWLRSPLEPEELVLRMSVLGSGGATTQRCARRPVSFVRYGAESDRFSLLRCDGSVGAEALDHLSVMIRPVGVARPELPLPEIPNQEASDVGEWVPSIKLVHPRLVWLVQQIANAFPHRAIYVVSGYRPGEHEGLHSQGRAIDLQVMGVADDRLYKLCRSLQDVGCGYYPNHPFVHVDVRRPGTGNAYWIDDSAPGEPSHYVDGWAGVESGGAFAWGRWRAALSEPARP
jgi:hypothetical protein